MYGARAMATAPNDHLLTQNDAINGNPNQPSEIVEFILGGAVCKAGLGGSESKRIFRTASRESGQQHGETCRTGPEHVAHLDAPGALGRYRVFSRLSRMKAGPLGLTNTLDRSWRPARNRFRSGRRFCASRFRHPLYPTPNGGPDDGLAAPRWRPPGLQNPKLL